MYYSFFGFGLLLRFQCKFTNNKKLRFAKCWSVKLSIWPESILFTSIGIIIFHSITLLYYVLCVSARLCYICCCCSMIIAHLVSSNLSIRKPFSFSCRQTKYRKFCLWKSIFCLFLALSPASIVLLYFQFFFLVANDERHLCKITIEIALLSIINYVVWIRTFFFALWIWQISCVVCRCGCCVVYLLWFCGKINFYWEIGSYVVVCCRSCHMHNVLVLNTTLALLIRFSWVFLGKGAHCLLIPFQKEKNWIIMGYFVSTHFTYWYL